MMMVMMMIVMIMVMMMILVTIVVTMIKSCNANQAPPNHPLAFKINLGIGILSKH